MRCALDLGLRSGEVARLSLDDIDWRAGTITLRHTKGRREDVLPLPAATGEAIAAYLKHERPKTSNRAVFVRHVAPRDEPVGPDLVRKTIRQAYARAGLPYTRSHLLRHTMANRLLAGGSSLKEVADVLRHRSLNTTHDLRQARQPQSCRGGAAVAGERIMSAPSIPASARRALSWSNAAAWASRRAARPVPCAASRAMSRPIGHRGPLTVEVMADWARRDSHGSSDPHTWARRLKKLRSFTRWLQQFEPRTEVPDDAIFGRLPSARRRTSTASRRSSICWRPRGGSGRRAACAASSSRRCSV